MATREQMIDALQALKKTHVEDIGTCVAGFDLAVSTSHGGGTACCQCGSSSVLGPVELSEETFQAVRRAGGDDDSDEDEAVLADFDDDDVEVLKALVEAKAKPGATYFYVFLGEDADSIVFDPDESKVYAEWVAWATEGTELTPWEDMDDDELEDWYEKVFL